LIKATKILLGKIFGHRFYLFLGDTLVLDRYLWLLRFLPITREPMKLIDIGCGTGAFTLVSAARGYNSLGISWDERNQLEAVKCGKNQNLDQSAKFEIRDIRKLAQYRKLRNKFDICVNFENIEHILDDRKLMRDVYNILKPGGMLIFSAPYYFLCPISKSDEGPFSNEEDGGHVRRGYTRTMLEELCLEVGFKVEIISGCSGFFSQKITRIYRKLFVIHPLLAWILILPFRVAPPLLDPLFRNLFGVTDYSICMVASKPRFKP
jgi:2-polyprenyl-3-methyl-5-hydroxy-6-metoxy-1,4-benzoquinol methylase